MNILPSTGVEFITDGKYIKFINAPLPLEETGSCIFKDVSGTLPGV
jgi:iron complex outermembrane receptor protein